MKPSNLETHPVLSRWPQLGPRWLVQLRPSSDVVRRRIHPCPYRLHAWSAYLRFGSSFPFCGFLERRAIGVTRTFGSLRGGSRRVMRRDHLPLDVYAFDRGVPRKPFNEWKALA